MEKLLVLMEKQSQSSHNIRSDKKAIHMVSAWAAANSLVLGQIKTEEKSSGNYRNSRTSKKLRTKRLFGHN